MIELQKSDFSSVLPLLSSSKQEVLPFSIAQGINPGRIFIDQMEKPNIVLIWTTVGYYFLFGIPSEKLIPQNSQLIEKVFVPASQESGETGFIIIPSTDEWKPFIPSILPGREVIEIFRSPHTFDRQKISTINSLKSEIPPGYVMQKMDSVLAEKIGVLASWSSIYDFLTHGSGFALLKDGQLVSYSYSVFSSSEAVEIDVHTTEKFRGSGLATLTCSTLIKDILINGKKPNWECFWENTPSLRLAEKLGFTAKNDYPVYFWEEES
jgi:hypothetical protein